MIFIFYKIRWPAIWTEKLAKIWVAGDVETKIECTRPV